MATMATQQVPAQAQQAAEDAQVDAYNVTPAQFREYIGQLITYYNQLNELGDQVATLQRGEKIQLPNGATIGRRELRSYRSQFANQLKELPKFLTAVKRVRKTRRTTQRNNGFNIPLVVSENMRQFFEGANLGPAVDPVTNQPTNVQLNTLIPLLTQVGITSSAVLTPLFCIYALVNNMQKAENRQYLNADQRMREYFAQTFQALMAQQPKTNKRGEAIAAFDPSNFRYASFQSIVSLNSIKPAKGAEDSELWTEQQRAYMQLLKLNLNDPEFMGTADPQLVAQAQEAHESLAREQQYASATLAYYREARAEEEKALRAEKRRAANAAKRAQQQQQRQAQQGAQQQQGFVGLQYQGGQGLQGVQQFQGGQTVQGGQQFQGGQGFTQQ